MSYTKLNFVNGKAPALSADNLNHMETGISDAHEGIASLETDLDDKMNYAKVTNDTDDALEENTIYRCFDKSMAYFKLLNVDGLNNKRAQFAFDGHGGNIKIRTATKTNGDWGDWSDWEEFAKSSDVYKQDEIDSLLADKADSATTLAGYGIEDAYKKTETDELLAAKADNAIATAYGYADVYTSAVRKGNYCFSAISSPTGQRQKSTAYYGTLLEVEEGEQYRITAVTSPYSYYVVYYSDFTYDADDSTSGDEYEYLSHEGDISQTYTDSVITVPAGAKYMGVCSYKTEPTIEKYGKIVTKTVAQAIEEKADANIIKQGLSRTGNISAVTTARGIINIGDYVYHTGNSKCAVAKVKINADGTSETVATVGGHSGFYPRNMAASSEYLYVPYRDNSSATATTQTDDIGGYLDIIKLSDFSLAKEIEYSRNKYEVTNSDGTTETKYFGKSHYTAVYDDKYLCVTQQMGGWLLYDITDDPTCENDPIYTHDNRAQVYIDNVNDEGYAEYQQPEFFTDSNGNLYLAICGYDRDLLTIYDLSTPSAPNEVFGYNSGSNQYNLRSDDGTGYLKNHYIHTMGIVCNYPYIYCTIAPYPKKLTDSHAYEGIAVVDVSDIANATVTVIKMPDDDRAATELGEPSPSSIAAIDNYLLTDNADKGVSVWSIAEPSRPIYGGNIDIDITATAVGTGSNKVFVSGTSTDGSIAIVKLTNTAVSDIADVVKDISASNETGSGTLSPTSTTYDGSAGTFIYAKSGNIVTVTLHMNAFTTGKSYVSMSGLPYKAVKAVTSTYASVMALTTSSVAVNVRVDGSWIYFNRTSGTFADSETLTVTLTYIISS